MALSGTHIARQPRVISALLKRSIVAISETILFRQRRYLNAEFFSKYLVPHVFQEGKHAVHMR